MLKMLGKTIGGFLIIIAGFYLGYVFIKEDGLMSLLSILTIPIVGVGAFLIKSGADTYDTFFKGKMKPEEIPDTYGFQSMLDKNNQITKDFEKTDEVRLKLKMMQSAGSAVSKPPTA